MHYPTVSYRGSLSRDMEMTALGPCKSLWLGSEGQEATVEEAQNAASVISCKSKILRG
jgi:hypothetical protein